MLCHQRDGQLGQVVIVIVIVIFKTTCLLKVGRHSLYVWKSLEVTINKRGALCIERCPPLKTECTCLGPRWM